MWAMLTNHGLHLAPDLTHLGAIGATLKKADRDHALTHRLEGRTRRKARALLPARTFRRGTLATPTRSAHAKAGREALGRSASRPAEHCLFLEPYVAHELVCRMAVQSGE